VTANAATIIIPVKNGLPLFADLCEALSHTVDLQPFSVLIIDSGSTDGSDQVALSKGFHVQHIAAESFGHGRTRNLGAAQCTSEYIVFLTQDAIPQGHDWLTNLLAPMRQDPEVAGVFARHIAHPTSSPYSARELGKHFDNLAKWPVVKITDRAAYDADEGLRQVYHFFSDNASGLRRSVWQKHPFPDVDFAEDQLWAREIVEAGYKKAFAGAAVVRHAHDFGPWQTLQRSYEESRSFRRSFDYKLSPSLRRVTASWIYGTLRDIRLAQQYGWWRSHPKAVLARPLLNLARPLGHYLGGRPALPSRLAWLLSRDDALKRKK
jgi:rhamnosyltransferase